MALSPQVGSQIMFEGRLSTTIVGLLERGLQQCGDRCFLQDVNAPLSGYACAVEPAVRVERTIPCQELQLGIAVNTRVIVHKCRV